MKGTYLITSKFHFKVIKQVGDPIPYIPSNLPSSIKTQAGLKMTSFVVGLVTLADHRKLFQVVPDDVKKIWNEWALRGLIFISLASQIILSLLGNVRKYNPRTRYRIVLWCAYLSAYGVASTALGIIIQTALDVCTSHKLNTSEVMSFWTPFLLLHLGGPDTITAFAVEDNDLWFRQFVELVFQSGVALYIFLLSWPGCSHLPKLSILVYVAGFIKCFERVQALRLSSTEHIQDLIRGAADPGPDYHRFLDEFQAKRLQGFTVKIEEVSEPLPLPENDHAYPEGGVNVISEAYDLFQTFKRLLFDFKLRHQYHDRSLSNFRRLSSSKAFSIVEIELGFAYDMLYTKASVVYTRMGLILRLASIFLNLLILVGFCFLCQIDNYRVIDITITYLLIATAVIIEIFAVIGMLCSDWTDHWLSQHNHSRKILILPFLKQPTKLRWSTSIAQLDLLSVVLGEKHVRFLTTQKFFGIDKYRIKHGYKTYIKVSENLKNLIYSRCHEVMDCSSDSLAFCTLKGSFSLQKNECDALLWSTSSLEFDQIILMWHIATTICYHLELDDKDQVDIDIRCMESKHISDYLLHLLVSYPVMLPIGSGIVGYHDTCADAMRFFKKMGPNIVEKAEASRKLLQVDCKELLPSMVKGDRSKSVLFDGCRLASSLREIETERMWKVMSQVWIEILAYAAAHCRGFNHVQQLPEGGEFFTHVWLLMAHLGISEQFEVSDHGRARLSVS